MLESPLVLLNLDPLEDMALSFMALLIIEQLLSTMLPHPMPHPQYTMTLTKSLPDHSHTSSEFKYVCKNEVDKNCNFSSEGFLLWS